MLVLGDSGLVGLAIIHQFKHYDVYGLSRKEFNFKGLKHICFDLEKEEIDVILDTIHPDFIISCTRGDYEAQLRCHKNIADYTSNHDSKLYYFSTANVFDGDPNSIHYEDDETIAESDYGKFKIKCENMLKKILGEKAVILRLPMVFGIQSPRVQEIRKAVQDALTLDAYENLYFTTILDIEIAVQLQYILENSLKGVFHLASKDTMKHLDFYTDIVNNKELLNLKKIDHYEKYYLAIETKRNELKSLEFLNQDVIHCIKNYILQKH